LVSSSQEADAAIQAMNDTELDGRRIRVNVAGERGGGSSSFSFFTSAFSTYFR
jgi:RNA recognition motif-containing protein